MTKATCKESLFGAHSQSQRVWVHHGREHGYRQAWVWSSSWLGNGFWKTSVPAPSDTSSPARPHPLILPKSSTNWRPSIQPQEPAGLFSLRLPYFSWRLKQFIRRLVGLLKKSITAVCLRCSLLEQFTDLRPLSLSYSCWSTPFCISALTQLSSKTFIFSYITW